MELLSPFTHITLVDDRFSEVKHIIDFFQKRNTPYTYYQYDGSADSLPNIPSKYVRILFMDLYLLEDGTVPEKDAKIVSGRFMSVLSTIVEPNTPYILIIWSKHIEGDEEQKDPGYLAVVERLKSDKSLTPLAVMPLDKTSFLKASESEQLDTLIGSGEELENAIITSIKNDIPAYTLLQWNNLVGKATDSTLQNFREIFAEKGFDANFVERLLFEFARAYLGKHTEDQKEKYQSVLHFITDVFKDNLEHTIGGISELNIIDINKTKQSIPDHKDFARINYITLMSDMPIVRSMPGCVFKKSKEGFEYYHNNFKEDLFNLSSLQKSIKETQSLSNKEAKEVSKEKVTAAYESCTFVAINITPICDFVQDKAIFNKYCYGVLYPSDSLPFDFLKSRTNYLYFSPEFLYEDKEYRLIIDFRLISDDLCDPPELSDYLFRIREQPLSEILHRISNHMGRPGIVFLDKHLLR